MELVNKQDRGFLPSLSPSELSVLNEAVLELLNYEEVDIPIEHFINEGIYTRTCKIPKGVMVAGCLMKIPTTVIVSGDCLVSVGVETKRITGYAALKGDAWRRQLFRALEDTFVTLYFKTNATTVQEAEKEMTDEWLLLTTNRKELDKQCQA